MSIKAAAAATVKVRGPEVCPLSVQAYHALGDMGLIPEKTELLYGQVYQKMSKSPLHRLLSMRLLERLRPALPPTVHVQQEQPITCIDSEPEPDLSVILGSIEDYATAHPSTAEFVVEVCVTSHEYDRSKLRAYAQADVKELWLVLAPEKQVEVYRHPVGESFRERILYGPGGSLTSTVLPQFQLELNALFQGAEGSEERRA